MDKGRLMGYYGLEIRNWGFGISELWFGDNLLRIGDGGM